MSISWVISLEYLVAKKCDKVTVDTVDLVDLVTVTVAVSRLRKLLGHGHQQS